MLLNKQTYNKNISAQTSFVPLNQFDTCFTQFYTPLLQDISDKMGILPML